MAASNMASRSALRRVATGSALRAPGHRCTSSRGLATAAEEASPSRTSSKPPVAQAKPEEILSTYLLLSRPPTIQRSPTPFEAAYYAYNAKLQRSLSQPFNRDLYFKKGSATETQFDRDETERQRRFKAGAAPITNLTLADEEARLKATVEQGGSETSKEVQIPSASPVQGSDAEAYRVRPRRTPADEQGDTTSLERSLDRTLFLLVRGGPVGADWTLPGSQINKRFGDAMHKETPEALYALLGKDMDIWMVTNLPIGITSASEAARRAYIMRAHIVAGKPAPAKKSGVEYAWLTSEEMAQRLPKALYGDVHDLLSA